MDYFTFLNHIIDDGIEAVKIDYAKDTNKMDGAIAGFEACRDKDPHGLLRVWHKANDAAYEAHFTSSLTITSDGVEISKTEDSKDIKNYWYLNCFESEVEWVCNVVSAILLNQGLSPLLSHQPTARAVKKAAEILQKEAL